MRLRRRMEDDIERDIRDHIEMETRENIERGMTPPKPAPQPSANSATLCASLKILALYGARGGSSACSRTPATRSAACAATRSLPSS